MQLFIRFSWFAAFAVLCFGVAFYSLTFLLQEINPNNSFQMKFAHAGWVIPLHFYCAGLALAVCPFQLSKKLRNKSVTTHRILGMVYVTCVLLGGISGLIMAVDATGGLVAKMGFASLALLWLLFTALALKFAISGDIAKHQKWIYRSVALTTGGITLRVFLGVGLGFLELPFLTVYVPAAWLSWLLNLAICELTVNRKHYFNSALTA